MEKINSAIYLLMEVVLIAPYLWVEEYSKGMYSGRLFAVSMLVFLQKTPLSGE